MRFVFAILAVMALLVSPVTAAVAQAACGHQTPSTMSGMRMTSMASMMDAAANAPAGDPCCDHAAQNGKKTGWSCAKACAAACAVASVVAPPFETDALTCVQAEVSSPPAAFPCPFEPKGLKRPPKSMA